MREWSSRPLGGRQLIQRQEGMLCSEDYKTYCWLPTLACAPTPMWRLQSATTDIQREQSTSSLFPTVGSAPVPHLPDPLLRNPTHSAQSSALATLPFSQLAALAPLKSHRGGSFWAFCITQRFQHVHLIRTESPLKQKYSYRKICWEGPVTRILKHRKILTVIPVPPRKT
jgi:hypothetical protein